MEHVERNVVSDNIYLQFEDKNDFCWSLEHVM